VEGDRNQNSHVCGPSPLGGFDRLIPMVGEEKSMAPPMGPPIGAGPLISSLAFWPVESWAETEVPSPK